MSDSSRSALAARERALDALRETMEGFTFAIAQMAAGHEPTFDACVTPSVEQWLRTRLQPMLRSGVRLAPDFGQFAELRVEGDLLHDQHVRCDVQFEDRSALQDEGGRCVRQLRRPVSLHVTMSTRPWQVASCAVTLPPL